MNNIDNTAIDEVRAMLAALDRQFTKCGIFLHNVHFNREKDENKPTISLNYECRTDDTDEGDSNEADH